MKQQRAFFPLSSSLDLVTASRGLYVNYGSFLTLAFFSFLFFVGWLIYFLIFRTVFSYFSFRCTDVLYVSATYTESLSEDIFLLPLFIASVGNVFLLSFCFYLGGSPTIYYRAYLLRIARLFFFHCLARIPSFLLALPT